MIQVFSKQEVVEWWIWKRITQYSWLISSLKPNFRNPDSVVPEKNVTKNIHGTDGPTEGQTEVKQYTPFFWKRGYKNNNNTICCITVFMFPDHYIVVFFWLIKDGIGSVRPNNMFAPGSLALSSFAHRVCSPY